MATTRDQAARQGDAIRKFHDAALALFETGIGVDSSIKVPIDEWPHVSEYPDFPEWMLKHALFFIRDSRTRPPTYLMTVRYPDVPDPITGLGVEHDGCPAGRPQAPQHAADDGRCAP